MSCEAASFEFRRENIPLKIFMAKAIKAMIWLSELSCIFYIFNIEFLSICPQRIYGIEQRCPACRHISEQQSYAH